MDARSPARRIPSPRYRVILRVLSLAALLLVPAPQETARQDSGPLALVGGRILPVSGPPIESGILVVHEGVIAYVGPLDTTPIPAGATVRDVTGSVIVPGFVDTHSHLGGAAGADRSAPIQPEVRVLDSIDVLAPGFQRAQAGGITTVNVMPGSGHLLSGQTVYLKLRDGQGSATWDAVGFGLGHALPRPGTAVDVLYTLGRDRRGMSELHLQDFAPAG